MRAGGVLRGDIAVLVPAGGWRRLQVVDQKTGRLLSNLDRLPASITPDDPGLIRLVLDGVIETRVEGRWRSGPEAHPIFFDRRDADPRAAGDSLARLSLRALRYAASLPETSALRLAGRLYRYNTRPASPAWRGRLRNPAAVSRLLRGLGGQSRGSSSRESSFGAWLSWSLPRPVRTSPTMYKLYVSPDISEIRTACQAVVGRLGARGGPFSVKAGKDLPSLLRPDKLVAYFTTLDDLRETARRLQAELDGMAAQGVPFTASLGAGELLSWGADGGQQGPISGPLGADSWRWWVSQRLAGALATVLAAEAPVSPVGYALDRLSLDGVDGSTWQPPAWMLEGKETPGADH